MKNVDFRQWQKALGTTLSVLLALTLAWASPMGGGFSRASALGVVGADAVPMSDGVSTDGEPGVDDGLQDVETDAVDETTLGEELGDPASAEGFDIEQAVSDARVGETELGEPSGDGSANIEASIARADADEQQKAAEERATDAEELGYVPGEIVVVYEDDASTSDQVDVAEAVGSERDLDPAPFESGDTAAVGISDDITVDTAIEAVEADPAVKYAFPNYIAKSFDEPAASVQSSTVSPLATGDELASRQWYLSAVKAPAAWSALAASGRAIEPVKVAVLDTGASITHPDLKGPIDMSLSGEVVWTDMKTGKVSLKPLRGDGYLNGTDEKPLYSTHGTHVAGIVAAKAGNGGVLGVASGGSTALANKIATVAAIDIFSCLADNSDGSKYASATVGDILYGLAKARDRGCSVVNMSLGFYTEDEDLIAALNEKTTELDGQGVVIVCAAGNDHTTAKTYPAACEATLGVISLSKRGAIPNNSSTYVTKTWESPDGYMRSWYSNYGDWCDVAAPGENIYSTAVLEDSLADGYMEMNGTSMASPMVAAVAALVKAANPDLSAVEVRDILCATATDLHTSQKDDESGWGLVNAEAAVEAALPDPQPEEPGTEVVPEPDVPEEEPPANLAVAKLSLPALAYTGKAQTPSVSVTLGGATLVQGRDYRMTISPTTVKAVGTYSVTIEGQGAYQGMLKGSFKVNAADISSAQIQAIGSQDYTGKAVTPQPKVTWRGMTLAAGTDYTVSYANNVNAGTAKLTITGKGNFTGAKTITFSIVKVDCNVWKTIGGKRYYYGANGQPVKWSQKIDGYWYYFDGSGVMQTGWVTWKADSSKSYFDGNGRALTGWQKLGGKTYYFDPSSGRSLRWEQTIGGARYYFNGASQMQTGWVTWKADKSKSYFGSDGRALTGFQRIGGKTYYFNSSNARSARWSQKIGASWYYFDGASQMQTGWVIWSNDKTKSYFGSDGRALTGFQTIGGKTYYFSPSSGRSLRWSQKIGGSFYYFDGASQMQTGWIAWNNDKTKSYFGSDGRALTGFQKIDGKTYYFCPASGRSLRWGQKIGGSFYYFDGTSLMQTGWVTWKADGARSYFDPKTGRAYVGWHKIGSKNYYFDPLTYKTR